MIKIKIVILMFLTIALNSCDSLGEDSESNSSESSSEEGQIYFRWAQNLANPGGGGMCNTVSGNFKDNNDFVPDLAIEKTYYGSCQPGTYNAQFDFDVTNPGGPNLMTFTYTLLRPEKGYKRYYTKSIREYYPSVNRCLSTALNLESLTFIDIKL